MERSKLILFITFGVFVTIIGIYIYVSGNKTETPETTRRQPTPTLIIPRIVTPLPANIAAPGQEYNESMDKIIAQEKPIIDREAKVGRLLTKMPYNGTNFSIRHDYNQGVFIVTIPRNRQQEGNVEFDEFIKQNGIGDRSWFRKGLLAVTYE
jgi:hypothetical protein